ncbi:broad substrate specificity ATP-binding cassette transporter ABCG2-like [Anneissia japonica]|uniref:broad substrate specificity ATP-binding cassette transporter ABCG2-like n=1 Tax=Anneissia japonica TaxID=1529436 RepID=UPI001425AC50|nr:broad substrate specificity ATP-binding cassette transporter ABCG2-like [Anneissia japonica]
MANINVAYAVGEEVSTVVKTPNGNGEPNVNISEEVQCADQNGNATRTNFESDPVSSVLPQTANGENVTMDGPVSELSRKHRFGDHVGSTLSFHDINYIVPVKVDGKKETKVILKSISGIFKPGMNAILGPTGSGKTSLLDVLADRKDRRGLMGTVLIDGNQRPSNFRLVSGYVVQDDVVMGTLSVRENLAFSAALRLPSSLTTKERETRVDDVIKELGLERCSDTLVGTELIRGVSGGERKRTNVGMELITGPEVIFLDEPTTGLDASTAHSVMELLSRLSKNGKTVIFSIHQPRYSIFRLFDTLHLLSVGETIYHGPSGGALEYFESAGYQCEIHNNPPDFFLDVINGTRPITSESGMVNQRCLRNCCDARRGHDVYLEQTVTKWGITTSAFELACIAFIKVFILFYLYTKVEDFTLRILNDPYNLYLESRKRLCHIFIFIVSFICFGYASVKGGLVLNAILNDASYTPMHPTYNALVIASIVFGFIDVSLSIISPYYLRKLQSCQFVFRYGAFFFMTMNMVFSNMSAVHVFIKERVVFIHESANGFYRVSSFFFSKFFFDILPMRVFPTILFSLITYWMIGLRAEADKYFIYLLNLIMTTTAASTLALCVGARISTVSIATALIPMCFVLMLIFGGLFVNITSLPVWLEWLKYISIFRYSLNTLSVNEFTGMTFVEGNDTFEGIKYLENQGIPTGTWGLWQNQLALFIMQIIFLTLAYIQLRFIPKWK